MASLALLLALGLHTPPAAAQAPEGPGALAASIRALCAQELDDPAADRDRWASVRTRSASFLARFPHENDGAEIRYLHAVACVRLGDAAEAERGFAAYLVAVPGGPRALECRYLRGLALVELGRDDEALTEMLAVEIVATGPLRDRALLAAAEVQARRGEAAAAMAALRTIIERGQAPDAVRKAAEADLRDLVRIGGKAPTPPGLPQSSPPVAVVVARREGEPSGAALVEAARAAAGTEVALVDLAATGFRDPRLSELAPPSLPRVYVLRRVGDEWRLAAAGVRGPGLVRALAEARASVGANRP